MSEPLFKDADAQERLIAPQQVPGDGQIRARLEGDTSKFVDEPPAAAPVASPGSSPSSVAAPPNIGHEPTRGAPGDPQTQARLDD